MKADIFADKYLAYQMQSFYQFRKELIDQHPRPMHEWTEAYRKWEFQKEGEDKEFAPEDYDYDKVFKIEKPITPRRKRSYHQTSESLTMDQLIDKLWNSRHDPMCSFLAEPALPKDLDQTEAEWEQTYLNWKFKTNADGFDAK